MKLEFEIVIDSTGFYV